jgi:aspartate carbamoyltransferase
MMVALISGEHRLLACSWRQLAASILLSSALNRAKERSASCRTLQADSPFGFRSGQALHSPEESWPVQLPSCRESSTEIENSHAHSSAGAPQFLAQRLKASVINAGDGAHEHPTQALLDLYTIREKRDKIAGLHVVIIGDILFSRVARSNIFGLIKLGARVTLVGPSTLVPLEFEKLGVKISHSVDDVLPDADVVNLLRIQHERQRKEYFPGIGEYTCLFGLTKERAKRLKPDCLIMHPGPINRGVEIDSEVADGLQSVILDQVTNGLAVRMAVLYLCGGIAT